MRNPNGFMCVYPPISMFEIPIMLTDHKIAKYIEQYFSLLCPVLSFYLKSSFYIYVSRKLSNLAAVKYELIL